MHDEGELEFPVLPHVAVMQQEELTCMSKTLETARYCCFSSAHAEIDRFGDGDERAYCVNKRRRTEAVATPDIAEETNRSQLVERPIPKQIRSVGAIADAMHKQYLWLCRASRSPSDIAARLESDRRVGVHPSLAAVNAVVRSLLSVGNASSALDFVDELLVTFPVSYHHREPTTPHGAGEAATSGASSALVRLLFGSGAADLSRRRPLHMSTVQLLVEGLCDVGMFVAATNLVLFVVDLEATLAADESASGALVPDAATSCIITQSIWNRLVDGLEGSEVCGRSGAAEGADGTSSEKLRASLASDVLATATRGANRVDSAVSRFGVRRILRHAECLLHVGCTIDAVDCIDRHILRSVLGAGRGIDENDAPRRALEDGATPLPLLGSVLSSLIENLSMVAEDTLVANNVASVATLARMCYFACATGAPLSAPAFTAAIDVATRNGSVVEPVVIGVHMIYQAAALTSSTTTAVVGKAASAVHAPLFSCVAKVLALALRDASAMEALAAFDNGDGTIATLLLSMCGALPDTMLVAPQPPPSGAQPSTVPQHVLFGFLNACSAYAWRCLSTLPPTVCVRLLLASAQQSVKCCSATNDARVLVGRALAGTIAARSNGCSSRVRTHGDVEWTFLNDVSALCCSLERDGTVTQIDKYRHCMRFAMQADYYGPCSMDAAADESATGDSTLKESLLSMYLRRCVASAETYVVVVDAPALQHIAEHASRKNAFSAMMTKYDATCGARLLVALDAIYELGGVNPEAARISPSFASCDQWSPNEAGQNALSWLASLARTGTSWLAVTPLSATVDEALRCATGVSDDAAISVPHDVALPRTASAVDGRLLMATLKSAPLNHSKVLYVCGSAATRDDAAALGLKPLVMVADLLTKLGVPQ